MGVRGSTTCAAATWLSSPSDLYVIAPPSHLYVRLSMYAIGSITSQLSSHHVRYAKPVSWANRAKQPAWVWKQGVF
jgi:hypothetical protein